jgi:hypothetical protein
VTGPRGTGNRHSGLNGLADDRAPWHLIGPSTFEPLLASRLSEPPVAGEWTTLDRL